MTATAAHEQARTTPPKPPIRHRKNVYLLLPRQLQALRDAFEAVMGISDNRGYQFYAGLHGVPGNWCVHHPPPTEISLFLPWHRAYLYFFELALRDQVPDAALTWWPWSSRRARTEGIPEAFRDPPLDGAPIAVGKQFGGPTKTFRNPLPPERLPDAERVQTVLQLQQFNRFSSRLEDVHDKVHGWVRGTMGVIAWAAYDPIFWAHHTNIDRLWSLWQLSHRPAFPDEYLDQALPPFPMTVRQTLNISRLGYDYASSTTHVT